MSFENNIQKWVILDNQIKVYSEKIKQLREEKMGLSTSLMEQADTNGYKKSVIQISDGKLKFADTKVTSPLTFRYVEDTLSSIIADENVRSKIIQCLKDNRETKIVSEIKRYN
jgi:hypothetical protein